MYAVVKTGGKQYRVIPGDVIVVEKLLGDPGDKIKLDRILMVGEDGQPPEIGSPLLANNAVNCVVIEQTRADKIMVFKKKRRKGYKRTKGHRQYHTVLRVVDINGKGMPKQKSSSKSTESKVIDKTSTKSEKKASEAKAVSAKKKTSTKKKATAKKKVAVKKSTTKKSATTKKSTTKI